MSFGVLERLAAHFARLPGVGDKTALRYAYAVLDMDAGQVDEFCAAMHLAKTGVKNCSVCGIFTDLAVCEICSTRDKSTICVVKDARDIEAFERLRDYNGVYHVLHGVIDPASGISPERLNIKSLMSRLTDVKEVIMATNPDVCGEATATYLARLIKPMGIKVSRLASGISIGQEVQYADATTLARALSGRLEY
jgi:recombination protein RecR